MRSGNNRIDHPWAYWISGSRIHATGYGVYIGHVPGYRSRSCRFVFERAYLGFFFHSSTIYANRRYCGGPAAAAYVFCRCADQRCPYQQNQANGARNKSKR